MAIIPNELKNFSSVIGPFVFAIFLISKKNIINYKYYFIGLSFFYFSYHFGNPLLVCIWWFCLFDIFISLIIKIINISIFFNFKNSIILIIFVSILLMLRVFPGSLSPTLYDKIMERSANGYSLMKWVNKELPKFGSSFTNSILLNFKSFNYYFLDFVDFKKNSSNIFLKVWGEITKYCFILWNNRRWQTY